MKQKIYYITIVERTTNTVSQLVRDEKTIDETVRKELGGWNNLHAATTSGIKMGNGEFFQAGVTKDDTKCFSILCFLSDVEE